MILQLLHHGIIFIRILLMIAYPVSDCSSLYPITLNAA